MNRSGDTKNYLGEYLLQQIEKRGITRGKLATETKMSRSRVNGVISGTRSLTTETAVKLATYLEIPPLILIRLQAKRDLDQLESQSTTFV